MIEKDRQDMSNPIGLCLCKLMLCSVFALLPYPHKAGRLQGFEIIRVLRQNTSLYSQTIDSAAFLISLFFIFLLIRRVFTN